MMRLKGLARQSWRSTLAGWLAILPLLTILLAAYNVPTAGAQTSYQIDPNMDATWKRTDLLVQQQKVRRSWLWGPNTFAITAEDYEGTPAGGQVNTAGKRLVAYYDKARMEVNNPGGDRSSKYFVTNGLLVKELISGKRALGDSKTVSYLPAEVPVAGDPTNNATSPTYASLINVASMTPGQNRANNRVGQTVTSYLERTSASVQENLRYTSYDVKIAYYENDVFGHNIPKVFWDFMNSQGRIVEGGVEKDGAVFDWLYSMGYAITEPFWTSTRVGGNVQDVLMQCFERRCLTYTPSNADGFKVEMGNVGQHYYKWRYQTPEINCSSAPQRGFGKLWGENPSVKARIGCPYNSGIEKGYASSYLDFERGRMYFINSEVYQPILILFNDGSWTRIIDTWTSAEPETAGLTPPPGLYEPKRGFGKAWRDQSGLQLRERLGWAKQPNEQGTQLSYLDFSGGFMIWTSKDDNILVGYRYYSRTSVYEIYPDTFDS
jgi:hypothetical protein